MSVDCSDGDYPAVDTERTVVARKSHECCACKGTIRSGDRYIRRFIMWEGSPVVYIHCLRCRRMLAILSREHFRRNTDTVPAIKLDCGHTWEEVFDEPPPPEVARLAFMTSDEIQAELAEPWNWGIET